MLLVLLMLLMLLLHLMLLLEMIGGNHVYVSRAGANH